MSQHRVPEMPLPQPSDMELLRVLTPCASLEQFVADHFLDEASVFVETRQPLPLGTRGPFTLLFRSGQSIRLGEAEVIDSCAADEERGVPGVTLRFLSLEACTREAVERFHSQGTAPAGNPFADPVLDDAENFATLRLRGPLPAPPRMPFGSAPTARLEPARSDFLDAVPEALTSVETQRHDDDRTSRLDVTARAPQRTSGATPLPLPAPEDSTIGLPRSFQCMPLPKEDSGPVIEVSHDVAAPLPGPAKPPAKRPAFAALVLVSALAVGAGVVVGYIVRGAEPSAIEEAGLVVEAAPILAEHSRMAPSSPAPPPAARSTPAACTVTVRSEPDGALVRWEQQVVGKTPLVHAVVPCGIGTLVLEHRRYRRFERRLTTTPDLPAELTLRLVRPPGTLILESRPLGAQFQVNGRPVGSGPASVAVNQFVETTVSATLPGFRAWSKKIYVNQDKIRIRAELVRR